MESEIVCGLLVLMLLLLPALFFLFPFLILFKSRGMRHSTKLPQSRDTESDQLGVPATEVVNVWPVSTRRGLQATGLQT